MAHVAVAKTYKLYLGGAFPRSESGRTYRVTDHEGAFMANAAQASRKDARDAVVAARKGQLGWAGATAYNRGQVIYRIAEMVEARRAEFAGLLRSTSGLSAREATAEIDASVERLVHFAGWTDKLPAAFGAINPVAGPFFSYSAPEPTGIVAAVAPTSPVLLGLVATIAPIIAGGNAAIVIAPGDTAVVAITLAEALATSDVPGGVINVLTGDAAEVMPHLAAHEDVNALDLSALDADERQPLELAAAETVKRVYAPHTRADLTAAPGTARLRAFLETKTVWHPSAGVSLGGGSGY
ncbi:MULTISPECIES: aldehyde dehydrogenase family protein [unclassified Janibacter]|uniref:aldehyde dehydrogenase family protein n=1 Tax=unclassified Janibacter TaxID=2649294 RepID=UPI003D02C112